MTLTGIVLFSLIALTSQTSARPFTRRVAQIPAHLPMTGLILDSKNTILPEDPAICRAGLLVFSLPLRAARCVLFFGGARLGPGWGPKWMKGGRLFKKKAFFNRGPNF